MLLIYKKETGEITGINTSPTATFENMYPNATEEFKEKYGAITVPYDLNYDKNRSWYKVENGEVIKLDSPFVKDRTRPKPPDPKDQEIEDLKRKIADLQVATAAILGGAV